MDDFVPLAKTADLAPGAMKVASVDGHEFLVARVREEYYITESHCPHMGGHLPDGTLQDAIVTCPLHRSQFDLRDGHVVRWTDWEGEALRATMEAKPPRPIRTYAIRVEGDTILVGPEKATPAAT